MCESSAHQERQEDHRLRPQRRLPQLHRGDSAFDSLSVAVSDATQGQKRPLDCFYSLKMQKFSQILQGRVLFTYVTLCILV